VWASYALFFSIINCCGLSGATAETAGWKEEIAKFTLSVYAKKQFNMITFSAMLLLEILGVDSICLILYHSKVWRVLRS